MQVQDTYTNQKLTDLTADKPTVLIADDARTMRASVNRILKEDFNVLEAKDGDEAWEIICQNHHINVVIIDLMMPNKNGFQLLREIRESVHDRINQLPIIIITSHEDDQRMKQQAMLLGATDFISKPFDSIQLKARATSYAKHGDTSRKLEYTRKMLSEKSTIDALTGLANPRYLKEHGAGLLAFAARQGTNVAVLLIDIDKFDVLVKKKGKRVGEKVLLNIARIIDACVREEDSVARIGPAKFAIVMPGADEAGARVLAERIHKLIYKATFRLGETRFRMTASAGLVCDARDQAKEFDDFLSLAEQRLAKAIKEGGNRLVLDEPAAVQLEQKPVKDAVHPSQQLTLEEALVLLKAGQHAQLSGQLESLIIKLYPLLEHGNQALKLGMDWTLVKLKHRLDQCFTKTTSSKLEDDVEPS